MLRDDSQSTAAIWTGYAALGILAAPAIDSAEQHEDEAVRSSRDLLFAGGEVAPGQTVLGYLIFESPSPVDELSNLALTVQAPGVPEAIRLSLPNPHHHD